MRIVLLKRNFLLLFVIFFFNCSKEEQKQPFQNFNLSYLKITNLSDEILENLNTNNFKRLYHDKIGYKNGWYWFKIELKSFKKEKNIIFNIDGNTIDFIKFYDAKKQLIHHKERMTLRSHSYKIQNASHLYYTKVHFKKQAYFPLKIDTLEEYHHQQSQFFFINGLFYGFVILVFIVNLIFYLTLKDISFLTYAIFLGLTNIAITDFDGLMALYTKPEARYWISVLLHFIVPLSAAVFTSTILNHHKLQPKSIKVVCVFLIISALCYTSFVITKDFVYSAIGDAVGLLIVTYYMFLGICELKRQKIAKFTVLGYSLIWISAILYMMPLNWGFDNPSVSLKSVKLGSILEMLALTYSIVYRVKLLDIENKKFATDIKNYVQQIFNLETKLQETKFNVSEFSIEKKVQEIANQNQLTVRETDLLLQIANGLNNKQIAEKLFISVNTVKYHTRNIYEKLDVKKRTEITSKLIFTS